MTNISSLTQQTISTSDFQRSIEALPLEDQALLIDIIVKRLSQSRREQLLREVSEVEQECVQGNVQYGSVSDFLSELDNCEV